LCTSINRPILKKNGQGRACSTYRRGMHTPFCPVKQEEIDHYEDLDIGEKIILK
jgi:hypothetical protein